MFVKSLFSKPKSTVRSVQNLLVHFHWNKVNVTVVVKSVVKRTYCINAIRFLNAFKLLGVKIVLSKISKILKLEKMLIDPK